MKKFLFKNICICLCTFMILSITPIGVAAENNKSEKNIWDTKKYLEYSSQNQNIKVSDKKIKINVLDYFAGENVSVNLDKSLRTNQNGSVSWKINCPEDSWYNISVTYCPVLSQNGFSGKIERTVLINNEIPFDEAKYVVFKRFYADDIDNKNGKPEFKKNNEGDDIPFSQKEIAIKQTVSIYDSTGYITEPLKFYFKRGENTITFDSLQGAMDIYEIVLSEYKLVSYSDYKKENKNFTEKNNTNIELRAELPSYRTDYTVMPLNDNSTVATSPINVRHKRLNTIGGEKWMTVGQAICWEFDVPSDGWYNIAFRCRQNVYQGSYSSRRLRLDGAVPFKEMDKISFSYSDNWSVITLGNKDEKYGFYLTKGTHNLELEVVLGDMAEILKRVSSVMTALNEDYLTIFTYTGSTPDEYRTYDFERLIPEVLEDFKVQCNELKNISDSVLSQSDSMGDNIGTLVRCYKLLEKINKDSSTIATLFSELKDDISALGTWVQTYCNQPLEIDSIYVVSNGEKSSSGKASFFENIWFAVKSFLFSFLKDYKAEYGKDDTVITVWSATGSEQAKITSRMIQEMFVPQSKIKVDYELIAGGTLLPSVLADMAPDVYLGAGASEPIDYALRSAVVDLNQFDDHEQVYNRFHKSAISLFQFGGSTWALPETQSFPVMFYRKDILQKLGISVPDTWDDFYNVIPILQTNNMKIGITWTSMFDMQLYQNGGQYYNDDFTQTDLYSNTAMKAFKDTTDLYTEYSFDVAFDFANRFRMGEMPIAIVDYLSYNTLEIFAPEIKGKWGMALVPGTVQDDGSVDRTVSSASTGVIMLSSCKKREAAWEFMKWWTSVPAQVKFSVEMESVLGASAKQAPSNKESLSELPWPSEMAKVIKKQRENTISIPQIPGGYYLPRALDFAFNSVYSGLSDSVSALEDNLPDLNAEIKRKRKEFGLPN